MSAEKESVVRRLDAVVDDFCRRTRYFKEPMTKGRARMFVMQHRQNNRHRNSVLKLKVAANCPDWDTRLQIIGACTQEVIADGPHIRILVNGKQTIDWTDPNNTYSKGHFALQGHDPGTVVTFKKIEYKPIKK